MCRCVHAKSSHALVSLPPHRSSSMKSVTAAVLAAAALACQCSAFVAPSNSCSFTSKTVSATGSRAAVSSALSMVTKDDLAAAKVRERRHA
jgi:hypothetical protein